MEFISDTLETSVLTYSKNLVVIGCCLVWKCEYLSVIQQHKKTLSATHHSYN